MLWALLLVSICNCNADIIRTLQNKQATEFNDLNLTKMTQIETLLYLRFKETLPQNLKISDIEIELVRNDYITTIQTT